MKLDGKTIYAQSSDIKSRTYLEYRRDMKKKAIAELEVLEWLGSKVKQLYPMKRVKVYKILHKPIRRFDSRCYFLSLSHRVKTHKEDF
jgi:hypothetical protein